MYIFFKYLELFAGSGIGGQALDNFGGKCIGFSEVDKFAIQNYIANFPNRKNFGDITKLDINSLPYFDVLIGGSPCQDISILKNKKGEKIKGLKGDKSKLFFSYIKILNNTLPKYFIFENVRNLLNTNNGKDFEIVKRELSNFYNIKYKILNTKDYGIPQKRNRIYIIGKRNDLGEFNFNFPKEKECLLTVYDLLEKQVDDKYYLSERMYKTVMSSGTKNFYSKPTTDLNIAKPLLATMGKMHRAGIDNYYHTQYIPSNKTNLRRLTPRECARLQGLSDDYKFVVSDTQAYKLMGNAMSLNVLNEILYELSKTESIFKSKKRNE